MGTAFNCFLALEAAVILVIGWRAWITRNRDVEPRDLWICTRCGRCSEDCREHGCPHGPCPMEFHPGD